MKPQRGMKIPCLRKDCGCHTEGQLPLFPAAEPPPKRKLKPTPGIRYAKFTPKTRMLCDDCVAAIHRLGVAAAPLPRPVRWRRNETDQPTLRLCEPHKEERQDAEARRQKRP